MDLTCCFLLLSLFTLENLLQSLRKIALSQTDCALFNKIKCQKKHIFIYFLYRSFILSFFCTVHHFFSSPYPFYFLPLSLSLILLDLVFFLLFIILFCSFILTWTLPVTLLCHPFLSSYHIPLLPSHILTCLTHSNFSAFFLFISVSLCVFIPCATICHTNHYHHYSTLHALKHGPVVTKPHILSILHFYCSESFKPQMWLFTHEC